MAPGFLPPRDPQEHASHWLEFWVMTAALRTRLVVVRGELVAQVVRPLSFTEALPLSRPLSHRLRRLSRSFPSSPRRFRHRIKGSTEASCLPKLRLIERSYQHAY